MDTYKNLVSEIEGLKNTPIQTMLSKEEVDKIICIIEEKLDILKTAVIENDLKSIRELTITIRLLIDGIKSMNF